MKKGILVTLLLVTALVSYSQSWGSTTIGNSFDGQFKIAYCKGSGAFPYTSPILAVRKNAEGKREIILSGVNSYVTGNSLIMMSFQGSDVVYSYSADHSTDGELWLVHEDKEVIEKIIEQLKTNSKVTIRLSTDYSHEDFEFSLTGSTKAINTLK
jgi:hypothetical protein